MSRIVAILGLGLGIGLFFSVVFVPIVVAISLPLTLFRGWVFSILWLWFAVPMGAPEIGYATATGLCLITGLAIPDFSAASKLAEKDDESDDTKEKLKKQATKAAMSLVTHFFRTVFTLGLGWFVHAFFM